MVTIAFLTQTPNLGNSCGAFALAYWYWLTHGRDPSDADNDAKIDDDKALVSQIYHLIRFDGNAPPSIESDYSNPVDMICMIDLSVFGDKRCLYYTGTNEEIKTLYNNMLHWHQRHLILKLREANRIVENELLASVLSEGQYAISICAVQEKSTEAGEPVTVGLHYVLIRKSGEDLHMYNSWNGTQETVAKEFLSADSSLQCGNVVLKATGAGILIPV